MSAFSTTKSFPNSVETGLIVDGLKRHFQSQGYEVTAEPMSAGGWYVSLSKGGTFKSVLGLKTSLNVELISYNDALTATAKVGIFGQQLLPSIITYFVAWPVIITQIWGLVQQSKLDDEVMDCIERTISEHKSVKPSVSVEEGAVFCTQCGYKINSEFDFCPKCGTKKAI
ncbi:MAG: zinc ribbon domain-containing protein [Clostridia bacterium]|nr:zinc ribbon domain-containing protein [Clostridia bacterium]